jgi:hypothetical protein
VIIIKDYDKRSLFSMLLKSYHHLHSLLQGEHSFPNRNEEDCNLDIFEMVVKKQ